MRTLIRAQEQVHVRIHVLRSHLQWIIHVSKGMSFCGPPYNQSFIGETILGWIVVEKFLFRRFEEMVGTREVIPHGVFSEVG